MGIFELVGISFVILGWIIRSIYKAVRWSAMRIKAEGAPLAPHSLAIIQQDPVTDRPVISRTTMTGVSRREVFSNETSPLYTVLDSQSISPTPKQFPLFENTDDLVRAMILQEILSPPRSRRISSR